MNKILNMMDDGTLQTLLLSSTGINLMYTPENMKLMNLKQKGLFAAKQLKDNT